MSIWENHSPITYHLCSKIAIRTIVDPDQSQSYIPTHSHTHTKIILFSDIWTPGKTQSLEKTEDCVFSCLRSKHLKLLVMG